MPFRRMLPQAGRWTLRAQLYFVLLVLAAFLLAWMGFEIAYNHHEMFDAEQAANRDRARVAAADIEQYLKHSEVMLDRLAQDASVRSLQGLDCGPIFAALPSIAPVFETISTMDRAGQTHCSTRPLDTTKRADGRATLERVLRQKGLAIGPVERSTVTGNRVVALSYPLRGQADDVAGQVIGTLDLLHFRPFLGRAELAEKAVWVVIDGAGRVVAHSANPQQYVGADVRDPFFARTLLQRRNDALPRPVSMTRCAWPESFPCVAPTGWCMQTGRPLQRWRAVATSQPPTS